MEMSDFAWLQTAQVAAMAGQVVTILLLMRAVIRYRRRQARIEAQLLRLAQRLGPASPLPEAGTATGRVIPFRPRR